MGYLVLDCLVGPKYISGLERCARVGPENKQKNKNQNEAQLLSLIDVPPPGQCGADCVTLVSVGCLISNLEHIQEPIKIKSIKI